MTDALWVDFKKCRKLREEWREQMLEGALPEAVWGTFLWSEWGNTWAFCLGCSQLRSSLGQSPRALTKPSNLQGEVVLNTKQYVWQTSNALKGACQSKWTFLSLICLLGRREILLFLLVKHGLVGTNAAFVRSTCRFGKKQSNLWAYSPS